MEKKLRICCLFDELAIFNLFYMKQMVLNIINRQMLDYNYNES